MTLADFRDRFPEFSSIPDTEMTALLAEAKELHGLDDTATLYLAAHLAALDKSEMQDGVIARVDGGGGAFTSESVGPKSASYATQIEMKGRDTFYVRTSYGRRFLALERRRTAFTAHVW
jgi:hypothetical protein